MQGVQNQQHVHIRTDVVNGDVNYVLNRGVPTQVVQFATPYTQENRTKIDLGLYAQDQWTIGRLTMNYGLRFDYFSGYVPAEHVAAILIEPVLGEGGYVAPPASFLRSLRELATRIGALLIFDEVQTGPARTGAWWYGDHSGTVPDLITTAKGLGSGVPVGALLARDEVAHWSQHTFDGIFGLALRHPPLF